MAYYLPSSSTADGEQEEDAHPAGIAVVEMAELRVFWGSEICRIEYLMHLLETGRIQSEVSETLEVLSLEP